MKGTVVMRFVGNRQEPEAIADPRALEQFFYFPNLEAIMPVAWWNEESWLFLERMQKALAGPSVLLNYGDRPR